jgi:hypothetical protein
VHVPEEPHFAGATLSLRLTLPHLPFVNQRETAVGTQRALTRKFDTECDLIAVYLFGSLKDVI